MSGYASLFKENNITGKRLLLLEEEDLKDMGIVSKGHIIHFKVRGRRTSISQLRVWRGVGHVSACRVMTLGAEVPPGWALSSYHTRAAPVPTSKAQDKQVNLA